MKIYVHILLCIIPQRRVTRPIISLIAYHRAERSPTKMLIDNWNRIILIIKMNITYSFNSWTWSPILNFSIFWVQKLFCELFVSKVVFVPQNRKAHCLVECFWEEMRKYLVSVLKHPLNLRIELCLLNSALYLRCPSLSTGRDIPVFSYVLEQRENIWYQDWINFFVFHNIINRELCLLSTTWLEVKHFIVFIPEQMNSLSQI